MNLKTQKDWCKKKNSLFFRSTADWPKISEPKPQHRILVDHLKLYHIYIQIESEKTPSVKVLKIVTRLDR